MPDEWNINAENIEMSHETQTDMEDCLSIPDIFGEVENDRQVTLRYRNLDFEEMSEEISDFAAVIFQDEADHLNGILH